MPGSARRGADSLGGVKGSTQQTIRRAWAQLLGVAELGTGPAEAAESGADSAVPTSGTFPRLVREVAEAETVSFVRVFGQGILSGPRWALDRASTVPDDQLALLPVLMSLAADHGARPLGSAELSYTDDRVEHADLPISQDGAAVAALEAACSDEDVEEVGLSSMPHRWILLDAPDGEPLAGSGYLVWADALAHMGVLTSSKARGRGYGVLAAAAGTNAALDAGLVPQWRARWDNEASQRLAQVLGYEFVGTQTTVFIA